MPQTTTPPGTDQTGTSMFPLVLGGNAFGWTADRRASFAVLDRFATAGGTLVDSADAYSAWVPGHLGGESEQMIGEWLRSRRPTNLQVATKVGRHPNFPGLHPSNIRKAVDASLGRLGVDVIDLYFAHYDDETIPLEETIGTFSALVDEGKILRIGLSNYTPDRVNAWFHATESAGFHRAVALEPHYSLMERDFEGPLREVANKYGLSVFPYSGLARGFLTGKYRADLAVDSAHAASAQKYLDARGLRVLGELDRVAERYRTNVSAVALAWLRQQPLIAAPIAGARTVEQLETSLASITLQLSHEDIKLLCAASEVPVQ